MKNSKSRKGLVKVMPPKAAVTQISRGADEGNIAAHMTDILRHLGEDPEREGLRRTPMRAEKALKFLTSGYDMSVEKILNGALYSVKYDEMVIVKDIEFFSMCEHHLLPFYGKVHVAYLPKDKVIGLSKIPRIVDMFSRRLQIQERLTQEIARKPYTTYSNRRVSVSSARRAISA
jgi:GTP cyclohydrolase IA